MPWRASRWGVPAAALLLAGCASVGEGPQGRRMVSDYPVRVGPPYSIGGRTYVPADDPGYDALGYASWYGAAHAGKPTANGERFDPGVVSAAHKTLPLPSYVEVTSIETGRAILVRVNDRGPFVDGRIIDLSAAAAQQLGMKNRGVAPVRVRRVTPSERDRAVLRAGGQVAARQVPATELAALQGRFATGTPAATERRLAQALSPEAARMLSGGGYVVELGGYADKVRADATAASLTGAWVERSEGLWRVRSGPYADRNGAMRGVEEAAARGYPGAHILTNDGT